MKNIVETPFYYEYGHLKDDNMDASNPTILVIDNESYVAKIPGNKGGHSFIITLQEDALYDQDADFRPTKVLKVSNVGVREDRRTNAITFGPKNKRFVHEVKALRNCRAYHFVDIINIDYVGYLKIGVLNKEGRRKYYMYFPFYMMDYANQDLRTYMDSMRENLDDYAKIDLCLQLSRGLKELYDLQYYHRDLKPDNILFVNGNWKIGDLGLMSYRNDDMDMKNEFIGPRGWESPEVMNKYLAEDNESFDSNIDHQSDLFQLGLIFWFIMQGNSPIGCIKRKDFSNPNEQIFEVIKRMIWHSKQDRYKDITEVISMLERILEKI